jgi:hypothetical protein
MKESLNESYARGISQIHTDLRRKEDRKLYKEQLFNQLTEWVYPSEPKENVNVNFIRFNGDWKEELEQTKFELQLNKDLGNESMVKLLKAQVKKLEQKLKQQSI